MATKAEEAYEDVEYGSLPADEHAAGGAAVPRPHRKRWNALSFLTGSAATILLAGLAITTKHAVFPPKTAAQLEAEEWNYCGRSSTVAKARGCVMEPLFYGWMPRQCVFQDLVDAHPVFEDRKWYSDYNLTQELRPQQLWDGEFSMIYTTHYHDEHCLYQWRKLQYGMNNRVAYLDNKTIQIGHEEHCTNQITEQCEPTVTINWVELGFYRCRKTIW